MPHQPSCSAASRWHEALLPTACWPAISRCQAVAQEEGTRTSSLRTLQGRSCNQRQAQKSHTHTQPCGFSPSSVPFLAQEVFSNYWKRLGGRIVCPLQSLCRSFLSYPWVEPLNLDVSNSLTCSLVLHSTPPWLWGKGPERPWKDLTSIRTDKSAPINIPHLSLPQRGPPHETWLTGIRLHDWCWLRRKF